MAPARRGARVKLSVTVSLDPTVLREVDRRRGVGSRSEFVGTALVRFLNAEGGSRDALFELASAVVRGDGALPLARRVLLESGSSQVWR